MSLKSVPPDAFTLPDVPGVAIVVRKAPGSKCERCWKVLPEVGSVPKYSDLCRRCAGVVEAGIRAPAAEGG